MVECSEQVFILTFPLTKTKKAGEYSAKEIKSSLRYLESKYRYEMCEDVHEVANYLER